MARMTCMRRVKHTGLAGKPPRIRSRPLAAKRAVPRIRRRPLPAKLTSTTERRLRNPPLAARASRTRIAAGHQGARTGSLHCAPFWSDSSRCFVQELVARAHRRPVAADTTLLVHRHLRPLADAGVHGRPLAVHLRPEGAARALAPETVVPVHLRPESAARLHRRPLAAETTLAAHLRPEGRARRPLAATRCC